MDARAARSTASLGLGGALVLQALVGGLILLFVADRAWDDGAITLAFARTFAEHGKIALTAASDPTEGFSSPLWFLLNTAVAALRPGFGLAIAASQGLAVLCLMACSLELFLIGRRVGVKDGTLAVLLVLFALFGPAIAEAADGMEMALLAATGLALVDALYARRNVAFAILAAVLFLLTRFEAAVYYAVMLAPLVLERRWRIFLGMAAFGLLVFGLEEAARLALFGDLLPNTVRAKMHAPYSFAGVAAVQSRLAAVGELAVLLSPLAVTLVFLGLLHPEPRAALATPRRILAALAAPVLAVELFAAVSGRNQGYPGRMALLGAPFALLLFGLLFDALAARLKPDVRRVLLILSAAITAEIGLSLASGAWAGQAQGDGAMAVTPQAYRRTGLSMERLRARLGLDRIVVVTPDVGGLGLCCERIRVIDLGLLTSKPLARLGYGALPALLAAEHPDVIEAHRGWAQASRIYDWPGLARHYRPAVVDGLRVYLRADHAQTLAVSGAASWCPLTELACLDIALQRHRYVLDATRIDDEAFLKDGGFFLLPARGQAE